MSAMASAETSSTSLVCSFCQAAFTSRNKLFKHISTCASNGANNIVKQPDTIQERLLSVPSIQNSSIVVIGGRLRGRTLQSCEKYSISTGTWELLPQMIENRGSHGAAVVSNTVLAIGGGGIDSNLCTCEALRPGSDHWEYIAPMQTKRHALSVLTHNNLVYAIGGWYEGSKCSGEMEIYDISSNTWSMGPEMSMSRRLLATTVWRDNIISIGGCCGDGDWTSNAVEMYSFASNQWTCKGNAPWSGQASATTINDRVFVFFHCKMLYEYNPEKDTWTELTKLPIADWCCFEIVRFDRFIFALGGVSQGQWLKSVWVFDSIDNTWWQLPQMLRRRRRTAATLLSME